MRTLKELREDAMLSQSELANLLGVDRQTISLWETGKVSPRAANQRKLLAALNCSPDELRAAIKAARKEQRAYEDEHKECPAA